MKVLITYLLTFCLLFSSTAIYAGNDEPEPSGESTTTTDTGVDPGTESIVTAQKCFDEGICTPEYMNEERTYSTVMLYISALSSFVYIGVCFTQPSSVTFHSVAVFWLAWEIIYNLAVQNEFDTTNLLTKEMALGNDAQLTSVVENIKAVNIAKQDLDEKIKRANVLKWGWVGAGIVAGVESLNIFTAGTCYAENKNVDPNNNDEFYFALLNPNSTIHSIDWSDPANASFQFAEQQAYYQGQTQSPTIEQYNAHLKVMSDVPLPKLNLKAEHKKIFSKMFGQLLISSAHAEAGTEELNKLGLVRDSEGSYDRLVKQIILDAISGIVLGAVGWKSTGFTRAMIITAHVLVVDTAIEVFTEARDQLIARENALRLLLREKAALVKDPSIDPGAPPTTGGGVPKGDDYDVPEVVLDVPGTCVTGSGSQMIMDASCECKKTNTCAKVDVPIVSNVDGFDIDGANSDLGELNSVINSAFAGKSSASTLAGTDMASKAAAAAKRLRALDELLVKKAKAEGKKPKSIIADAYKHRNALVNSVKEKWPMLDASIKDTLESLGPTEVLPKPTDAAKKANSATSVETTSKTTPNNGSSKYQLKFGKDLNNVSDTGKEIKSEVVQAAVETNPDLIKEASEKTYDGSADDIWINSEGDIWKHISWRYKKSGLRKLELE